jgi:hypothetical protein
MKTKGNYKLLKLMVMGFGVIFGANQYGSLWIEFRASKKLKKQFHFINNNPRHLANKMGLEDYKLRQAINKEMELSY